MDDTTMSPQPNSYINAYTPPVATQPTPAVDSIAVPIAEQTSVPAEPVEPVLTPAAPAVASQTLEDQNIFFLLGVTDGTDQEKEAFLDELQQVIWEDFLENDVELLVTEEELAELKKIMAEKLASDLELQEKIIVYLEKLIPDLEEIMLEKALELKEDMARERVAGMREYYASNQAALDKIQQAEAAMNNNQWRAAAEFLNSL